MAVQKPFRGSLPSSRDMVVAWTSTLMKAARGGQIADVSKRNDLWDICMDDP